MKLDTQAATIANGASLSDAIKLDGQIIGLNVPTMTAAQLTFQASTDNVTWRDVYKAATSGSAGTELVLGGAGDTHNHFYELSILAMSLQGVGPWLRIRSGVAATPVNQGAARVIDIVQIYFD